MGQNAFRARLLAFSIISSIFLISVFTFVQLNNQLQATQKFKIFQAQQAAVEIKQRLHDVLPKMPLDVPRSRVIKAIKQTIAGAIGSGAVDTVVVLSKDGNPVVSQGRLNLVFDGKKYFLSEIWDMKNESKWLVPLIDEEHGLAGLFFEFGNPYEFTFKLFFSLGTLWEAMSQVYISIIFVAITVIIVQIALVAFLSRVLARPIETKTRITRIGNLAVDNLERIVDIKTQDELKNFTDMLDYIITGPGNTAARKESKDKSGKDRSFLVLYTGPDNFKAFITVGKTSRQSVAKKDADAELGGL